MWLSFFANVHNHPLQLYNGHQNELHSIINLLFTSDYKHQLKLYDKQLLDKWLINHPNSCEQGKLINSDCCPLQSVTYVCGNICLTIYKNGNNRWDQVTADRCYYIHVGPVACKQCLILCQQRVVLLTDTKKATHTAVRTRLCVWL